MLSHRTVLLGLALVLFATGCNSGDSGSSGDDQPASGSIGSDENNRYQLDAFGAITFIHTGGLICSVEDGDLVLDFSIDASNGDYEYAASFPAFDPSLPSFEGEFTLTYKDEHTSVGIINLEFGYGPAPDDYPGVVRASGNFAGPISGSAGAAEIAGSYACFLMDSEVGA